jgi:hypothetical protein
MKTKANHPAGFPKELKEGNAKVTIYRNSRNGSTTLAAQASQAAGHSPRAHKAACQKTSINVRERSVAITPQPFLGAVFLQEKRGLRPV